MVTITPTPINEPITSFTEASIMFASSVTVTNSVTCNTLLSSAAWISASSSLSRRSARLSRRILAPLFFLPEVSFSRVSLICFWICSSVNSCFATTGCLRPRPGPCPGPFFWGPRVLLRFLGSFCAGVAAPGPCFLIRVRFFLFSFGFSTGSTIFWPVNFGPSILTYFVLISWSTGVGGVSSFTGAFSTGFGALCAPAPDDFFVGATLVGFLGASFFFGFWASRSILPMTLSPVASGVLASWGSTGAAFGASGAAASGVDSSAVAGVSAATGSGFSGAASTAGTASTAGASSAGLGATSATGASAVSFVPLRISFSSFTCWLTSSERFFRARSSANAVIKTSYWSFVILWLRLFGISWPCLANSSTARSKEMLSSFVALLNLTLLIECL